MVVIHMPETDPFREFVNDYLTALDFDQKAYKDIGIENGLFCVAIGDQAVQLRYSENLNGFLLSTIILELNGFTAPEIAYDLMLLNGRLHDTGGLVFGMSHPDAIVASIIVPIGISSPEILAQSTTAFLEAAQSWAVILKDGVVAIVNSEIEDVASSETKNFA